MKPAHLWINSAKTKRCVICYRILTWVFLKYSENFRVKKFRQIRVSSKKEVRNDEWNKEIGLWKERLTEINLYRLAMWQEKQRADKHESDVNTKNYNQGIAQ